MPFGNDEDEIHWGPHSVHVKCPECGVEMNTYTSYKSGMCTHAIAIMLCGLWCCPFALLPYCFINVKDVLHYCNNCGAYIGAYEVEC